MDDIILHDRLFDAPWGDPSFRRLPGMRPVGADDWMLVDEAYARQMALRDRFLATRRDEVVAALPEAREAAAEVLELVLATLSRRADFAVGPDGDAAGRGRGAGGPGRPLRHRRAAPAGGRLPPREARERSMC
jgi:hypothetical protein